MLKKFANGETHRRRLPSCMTIIEATTNLHVHVDPNPTVSEIHRQWQDLEARATPTFFLSSSWIDTLLEVYQFRPQLIVAKRRDRIVGLGLLASHVNQRFGLRWPCLSLNETGLAKYDSIMIEDNGFLTEKNLEQEVVDACFNHVFEAMPDWRELRLSGVTEVIAASIRRIARNIAYDKKAASPYILCNSPDLLGLSWMSANTRYQVRRAMRLYGARGELRISPSLNLSEARNRLSEMAMLHERRWASKGRVGAFANPDFERFHQILLNHAYPLGHVDILRVECASQTIGLLYIFFYNGEAAVYQNGFCYENDSRLKPGMVSHVLALRFCAQRGIRKYRLLAGSSRYKESLATDNDTVRWMVVRRPHIAFGIESALRAVTGRTAA